MATNKYDICTSQRIASITVTLQHSLERSFRESLESAQPQILKQCLRTYATIDKMKDAEALYQQVAVKPFMDEVSRLEKSTNFLRQKCMTPPSHLNHSCLLRVPDLDFAGQNCLSIPFNNKSFHVYSAIFYKCAASVEHPQCLLKLHQF